jgi:inner membrane transporter RhtA
MAMGMGVPMVRVALKIADLFERRAVIAAGLVVGACSCVQVSAALVKPLFGTVGVHGISGIRMFVAAVVLLILARPRITQISMSKWIGIVFYGMAMAGMNVCFYNAVERLSLGVAVTLEFLGPFSVAFMSARRKSEFVYPIIALCGVALISQTTTDISTSGVAWALGAAVAYGGYTFFAGHVGRGSNDLSGLALSVVVGAACLSPFSLTAVADTPNLSAVAAIALSGIIGVAIAFSLTYVATRRTSARHTGTYQAADPAVGAIVGAALLHEPLGIGMIAGVLLVVFSAAAVTWRVGTTRGPKGHAATYAPG